MSVPADLLAVQARVAAIAGEPLSAPARSTGLPPPRGRNVLDDATFETLVRRESLAVGISPSLVAAVAQTESGRNPSATSAAGAAGMMQLMPATATRYGVANPYDPNQNVHGGARYLKFLINRFGQDVKLALAAYNAGEDAVDRSGGQIPPFAETQAYVPRVLKIYRMLAAQTQTRKS